MKFNKLFTLFMLFTLLLTACGAQPTVAPKPAELNQPTEASESPTMEIPTETAPTPETVPTPESAPAPESALIKVKFGNLPYLDYGPWVLAEQMGYLKEEGIELETTMFEVEQPMTEALISGSIDAGAGADTPFILMAGKAPELRLVSLQSIFTGYSIMGRPKDVKTYEQLFKELGDRDQAMQAAAAQLKGKTIILPGGASFTPVLDTALKYGKLTRDDVKIIDMDPVEGAAAFIQGTADFYSDGLPQRFRLEKEGMVNVLTGVEMAGGAMDLAGLYTTQAYLDKNPKAIEGMLRAWYRAVDYLKKEPDKATPIMVDWINKESGAGMKVEEANRFLADLVLFPTYKECGEQFFTEGSPFFWKSRLEFVIDHFSKTEELDATKIDLDKMVIASSIYPKVAP